MPRKKKLPAPPLPKHAEIIVYLDPDSKIPVYQLDDLEKRALGLHEETKNKRSKKRKKEKKRPNFIEENPKLAEIKFTHLKTALCRDRPLEDALIQAWISRWQYYRIREDDEVRNILEKWRRTHLNLSRTQVNLAIRNGNEKMAWRVLQKRDPRYRDTQEETMKQTNQMVNIFLNVSQETKNLILSKYAWWTEPPPLPNTKEQKSIWWSSPPETRWFLSPNS